jgi:hypothetical protein
MPFEERDVNATHLPQIRYVAFNCGVGPSQWIEQRWDYKEANLTYTDGFYNKVNKITPPSNDEDCAKTEQTAFHELISVVQSRAD